MLIGVYFVLGVALDIAFYPFIIRWQPPWLTFTLAVGEFVLVYILAHVLKVGLTQRRGGRALLGRLVVAIWTKVVILPLLSLELDRERRRVPLDRLVGGAGVPAAGDHGLSAASGDSPVPQLAASSPRSSAHRRRSCRTTEPLVGRVVVPLRR